MSLKQECRQSLSISTKVGGEGYLKKTEDGRLSAQIVIDEEKVSVNGKRIF